MAARADRGSRRASTARRAPASSDRRPRRAARRGTPCARRRRRDSVNSSSSWSTTISTRCLRARRRAAQHARRTARALRASCATTSAIARPSSDVLEHARARLAQRRAARAAARGPATRRRVARIAGTSPACTNDDLPTPDGPITASSGHVSSCASAVRISFDAAEEELRVALAERREPAIRADSSATRSRARREERLQIREQLGRVVVAIGLSLREAAIDDRDQLARQRRIARRDARQRRRRDRSAASRSLSAVIVPAGCTPVERAPEHDADRPEVRLRDRPRRRPTARATCTAACRRSSRPPRTSTYVSLVDVGVAASRVAASVEHLDRRWSKHLRDAEIEHLHLAAIGDEDVRGLRSRWTMPCSCARSSARTTGDHQLGELPQRSAGSRAPRDSVLPSRYSSTMNGRPCVLADLVDRDDVLVRAARRRARLDEEPLRRSSGRRGAGT